MEGVSYLSENVEDKERLLDFNPKGFWNFSEEVLLRHLWNMDLQGLAIKVLAPSHGFARPSDIETAIVCTRRSKIDQARSLSNLITAELEILPNCVRREYLQYFSMVNHVKWLEYYDFEIRDYLNAHNIKYKLIFFEDWKETPDLSVREVAHFVDSTVNPEAAIRNIDN
jgi:hypothetical protein